MKKYLLICLCLLCSGCATVNTVGSKTWYNYRMDELQSALYEDKISTEKYLELKNEADKIRQDYVEESNRYFYYQNHYYCRHHHGYYHGHRHKRRYH